MSKLRDELKELFGDLPEEELIRVLLQSPAVITIVGTPKGEILISTAGTITKQIASIMLVKAYNAISQLGEDRSRV